MKWLRGIARLYVPRLPPVPAIARGLDDAVPHAPIEVIETCEEFTRAIMPALVDSLPPELALDAFAALTRRFDELGLFILRTEWNSVRAPETRSYNRLYRAHVSSVDSYKLVGQSFVVHDEMLKHAPESVGDIRDRVLRDVGAMVLGHVEEYNAKKRN